MRTLILFFTLLSFNLINTNFSEKRDDITKKVDSFMNECIDLDLFSGTLLIAKDGNTIFEKSYGYADKDKKSDNTNATKYNIGSIGKDFTAILILQLVQENKLSLEDNLGKYLNYFPEDVSSAVTIKHLLNHSSGLGDYIMNHEFNNNKENYKELSELVKLISKEKLAFAPGTNQKYSNSGYVVLGAVIESITGKSYIQNLNERILEPLSMTSSGYIDWDTPDPLKATGYTHDLKGNAHDNKNLRLQPSPAGGMYSTVEDLLKLDQSLMNDNKLLSDYNKMIFWNRFEKPAVETFEEFKNSPNFIRAVAGGADGINAVYITIPAKGYSMFILSNYDHAAENIEKPITSIVRGVEYSKAKLPLNRFLYQVYEKEGEKYFAENLKNIIDNNDYKIPGDGMLNNIGYQFLQNEFPAAAIEIFKLNAILFPNIANVFDSLGEAYLALGNKEEAKKNYLKVLEINPENENVKKILEGLK
ncbi:MAG: serine hydrolase [bacterium]